MIAEGMADIDAIECHLEAGTWPFAVVEAAMIDAHWDKRRQARPSLFNGRVLLARDPAIVEINGRRVLRAGCIEADYKAFLTWLDIGRPDTGVCNIFGMAALRARDGAFVLGKMGAHTAAAGKVYFPAGTPEPADLVDGRLDLAGSVLRELAEETGIGAADVQPAAGWTIVKEGGYLACMRVLESHRTFDEIDQDFAAFRAREKMPELDALIAVASPNDIDVAGMPAFMRSYLRRALSG